jgi:hypothetical protein
MPVPLRISIHFYRRHLCILSAICCREIIKGLTVIIELIGPFCGDLPRRRQETPIFISARWPLPTQRRCSYSPGAGTPHQWTVGIYNSVRQSVCMMADIPANRSSQANSQYGLPWAAELEVDSWNLVCSSASLAWDRRSPLEIVSLVLDRAHLSLCWTL